MKFTPAKRNYIKILSITLALILLLPLVVSCANDGKDGLSAYELALQNGATTAGSEEEWLAELAAAGKSAAGKSAYELACEAGFDGTLEAWLASLAGADGRDGADGTNGARGKSAYEVAVDNGYTGSESAWVAELLGNRTDPGTGSGVGISSVYVNAQKHLIVRLTNGTTIDAGYIGVSGTEGSGNTDTPVGTIDSDGYAVVNQIVTVIAGALNIRSTPDASSASNVITYVEMGTELNRIGIGTGDNTWSKVMYNGAVCYASSKYLEVKSGTSVDTDLTGIEIPKVNLLDSYTLMVGKETSFVIDQFVVGLASDMYTSFIYSGSGTKVVGASSISITPTAAENAELTFTIKKYIHGNLTVIYSKTVKLISVRSSAVSLTGLIIGDSRIADGTLVDTLTNTFGTSNLRLIGTLKTTAGSAHEGRSSWSAANYASYSQTSSYTNPFFNSASAKFDFQYYLTKNSYAAPDFVVFNLGANDNYSTLSIIHMKNMVDSILTYNAANQKKVKILIMTEYLAPTDGYKLSYCPDIPTLRELQFEYLIKQNEAFGNRISEGIYLIPNYIVVDNTSDRRTTTDGAISDIIHLNVSGYKKEADILSAYIYSIFAAS